MSQVCASNRARRRGPCATFAGALPLLLCLASAGCPSAPAPDGDSATIFPENYRSAFVEVRGCRASIEHAATIRVWVNEVGADAYLADENPLPVGSVVVKEEYAGADCSDDADLVAWSVMRKESAGFDAEARDWRFQESAAPSRRVTIDGNSTCLPCHLEPECVARDLMCTEP